MSNAAAIARTFPRAIVATFLRVVPGVYGCGDVPAPEPALRPGTDADLRLVEIQRMGQSIDGDLNAVLASARWASVDPSGVVYVADIRAMAVKAYRPDGTFVGMRGAGGEGPGEFSDLTTIASGAGRLYTFDWMRRRLSVFDAEGALGNTYRLLGDSLYWPRSGVVLPDSSLILLFKHERHDAILHHVRLRDDSLDVQLLQSFGTMEEIYGGDAADTYVQLRSEFTPGSVALLAYDEIVFAPYLYGGRLFRYRRDGESWESVGTMNGGKIEGPAYRRYHNEPFPPDANVVHGSGKFAAVIYRQSAGLLTFDDGTIIHFVFQRDDERQTISAEVVKPSGAIHYVPNVVDLGTTEIQIKSPWMMIGADADGRAYATSRRDGLPVILVYRLESRHIPAASR